MLVFARYPSAATGARQALRALAGNPLIQACGIGLHLLHLALPPGIDGFGKPLGAASLPLGLLCVGAALVAVLFNALATASSSCVMARQRGGDARLMANVLVTRTIAAAVPVPLAMLAAQAAFR